MASLKDINATIEEGNDDLEKLNKNFAKWLESQKKSGDDLESAKEARNKKPGLIRGMMPGGNTGGQVNKGSDKTDFTKYLKYAIPLALPILYNQFRDFLNKPRFDLNGDGTPDLSVTQGGALAGGAIVAAKLAQVNRRLNNKFTVKLEKIRLDNTIKAIAEELKAAKLRDKLSKELLKNLGKNIKVNLQNVPKNIATGLKIPPGFGVQTSGLGNQIRQPMIPGTFSQPTGTQKGVNTNRAAAANTNAPKNTKATTSSKFKNFLKSTSANAPVNTKATTSSKFKNFLKSTSANVTPMVKGGFNSIKQGMSGIKTGAKAIMPKAQAFGQAVKTYIKALQTWANGIQVGATAKRVGTLLFKVLLKLAKFASPLLSMALIAEWASIMYSDASATAKMSATGGLLGGFVGMGIGAAIGAAIGGPVGSVAGAVLGGMSGMAMGRWLFAWGANDRKTMDGMIKNYQAMMFGGLPQTDTAFTRIDRLGGKDLFQQFAQGGGNDNVIQRDDFSDESVTATSAYRAQDFALLDKMKAQAAMIPGYTAMGASKAKAKKYGSFLNKDLFLGGADRLSEGNKTPDFVRGISGGGSSGALTFPEVGNELSSLSNQQGAGMIRRGSEAPPVNVTANSGNTTSSVTTVISGGGGLNTVDTRPTFFNSVGPMSNLERARMR